jgi:hypothetical protein
MTDAVATTEVEIEVHPEGMTLDLVISRKVDASCVERKVTLRDFALRVEEEVIAQGQDLTQETENDQPRDIAEVHHQEAQGK